jgi:hypothetical protein
VSFWRVSRKGAKKGRKGRKAWVALGMRYLAVRPFYD